MVGLVVLCLKSGLPNGIYTMGARSIDTGVTKKTINTTTFHPKNYETHSILAMLIATIRIDVNHNRQRSSWIDVRSLPSCWDQPH